MKTSKQKALDFIQKHLKGVKGKIQTFVVSHNHALEAIDIATTLQWYYPSKKEICTVPTTRVLAVHVENYHGKDSNWVEELEVKNTLHKEYSTALYSEKEDDTYLWKDIVAWTYLPKFTEEM